ncbi:MAG: branched-chain amino acid ABC transporter permease LivH [Acidimicrobiia bacterium]|nr:branched-chain amino acid ABC transporter permease LivH [Acidimicrobiia bacterium]NNF10307.1 branched-chain amino acid ABC transporter permease LivH [Acidimicrobiia bacterium]NNL71092.1 branched-chain amino acid ABC transporter permease LivH [Acidimicrobiia bacterium]
MTVEFFLQQTVNGLTLGSVYALIALGYSMVYGILKLLNFAHGEVYMFGAFAGYGVLTILGGSSALVVPVWLAIMLMFGAAMIVSAAIGVALERFAYRPLRNSTRIAPLISAIGASFFLQAAALLMFTANSRSYNTPSLIAIETGIPLGPIRVWMVRVLVIVTAFVLMILLTLWVNRSRTGKAVRAVSFDREAAAMMGIDVDKVIVVTFLIGSALAGIGGVMVGLVFGRIFHLMGFVAGLKAFTAAVVGGIGSIPGAMLGGLLIGFAEAYTTGYISSTFQNLIVFGLLIVVLLVRPSGLLGRPELVKV